MTETVASLTRLEPATRRELVPTAKRTAPQEVDPHRRRPRAGRPLGRGGRPPPPARPEVGGDHRRGRPLQARSSAPTDSAPWSGPSSVSKSRPRPPLRSTCGSANLPASPTPPEPLLHRAGRGRLERLRPLGREGSLRLEPRAGGPIGTARSRSTRSTPGRTRRSSPP